MPIVSVHRGAAIDADALSGDEARGAPPGEQPGPGRLAGVAAAKGVGLEALSLPEMQEAEPRITDAAYAVLGVANSVASRTSYGGTAPDNVRRQAQAWIERLG